MTGEAGGGPVAGGGGLGGWLMRRRSKDVLGYEGAGFSGAVTEEAVGGEGGGRLRRLSGASGRASFGRRASAQSQQIGTDELDGPVSTKFQQDEVSMTK